MGMEKRGEPRFPVTSPIRVVLPGEGGHTIDSTLIDISGTGMRFLAPESMEAENVVGIEVDSRLILAEVRYCQPRGGRFVVGARRLHEIAKDAQLADAPAVVSEMLGHLRRHLAAADAGDSQSMAVEALEKIVERNEHPDAVPPSAPAPQPQPELVHQESVAPEPQPEPELVSPQPQPEPTPQPELVHQESVAPEPQPELELVSPQPQPEPTPQPELVHQESVAPEPQPEPELVSPQPAPQPLEPELVSRKSQPEPALPPELPREENVEPPPLAPELVSLRSQLEPAPEPPLASQSAPVHDPEPQRPPIVPVTALPRHVDPLEAARQALSADSESANGETEIATFSSRNARIALALAASLILAALLSYLLLQHKTQAQAPAPATAAAPAPLITVESAPAPPQVHHAQIHIVKPTWLSLAVDGGHAFKSVFQPNDTHLFDFSKSATLRVADGAAVEIRIDGNSVGPIEPGQQILQISPRGVELVK